MAFSALSNGERLLKVGEPAEGTIPSIHGIRFISLLWVVLGHTYFFALPISSNGTIIRQWEKRWSFQVVDNAYFAVDSFFVLSGLLLMYLSLREREKKGRWRCSNWIMFYVHRLWRLTPAYMLVLMSNVGYWKYLSNGPAWRQDGFETENCKYTWWSNLFYLNNFVNTEKMCMVWSWYLANDMQIYIISPLIMICVFKSKLLSAMAFSVLLVTHVLTNALITNHYDLGVGSITDPKALHFMNYIYYKPYTRVGPYAIGMLTGYLLFLCRGRFRMTKGQCVTGWLCSLVLGVVSLYGLAPAYSGHPLSLPVRVIYNSFSRIAWGLFVAWSIFACATGNGGIINRALSWKALVPFSRLTYCAYLVHPLVMYLNYYSLRQPIYLTDFTVAYQFMGNLVLAFCLAFVTSLCFESPMMGLEKALWRK